MTDSKQSAKKAILFTSNYLKGYYRVYGYEKAFSTGSNPCWSLLHFNKKTMLTLPQALGYDHKLFLMKPDWENVSVFLMLSTVVYSGLFLMLKWGIFGASRPLNTHFIFPYV